MEFSHQPTEQFNHSKHHNFGWSHHIFSGELPNLPGKTMVKSCKIQISGEIRWIPTFSRHCWTKIWGSAASEVATVTPEPPPLSAARCVCKSFCRPSSEVVHPENGETVGKMWEKLGKMEGKWWNIRENRGENVGKMEGTWRGNEGRCWFELGFYYGQSQKRIEMLGMMIGDSWWGYDGVYIGKWYCSDTWYVLGQSPESEWVHETIWNHMLVSQNGGFPLIMMYLSWNVYT